MGSEKTEIVSKDEVFLAVQQVSDALQRIVEEERQKNGDAAAERLDSLQLVALGALWKLKRGVQGGEVGESIDRAVEYVTEQLVPAILPLSNVPSGNA